MFESRTHGEGVMGGPPVKWSNKADKYWRRLAGDGLSVLRENAKARKMGNGLGLATP